MSGMKKNMDRAARRAQEEYGKAIVAFQSGRPGDAAYYLGAMAHYVGDVSQYGHTYPNEKHHSDYEGWVGRRTKKFDHGVFESYLAPDGLKRRTPYTAVKRVSKATKAGKGKILPALEMDGFYKDKNNPEKNPPYLDSIGHSLNLGVNELADVLHTFFMNVVSEEEEKSG